MVNFTSYGFNLFKRYKSLPFAMFFFSREIRRRVWKLKDHFPMLEKSETILNSQFNYIIKYKQALLALRKAKYSAKGSEITEIKKNIAAYEKAIAGLSQLLAAELVTFTKELSDSFKVVELIEYSSDALEYRNAKIMTALRKRAETVLRRIYETESSKLAKQAKKLTRIAVYRKTGRKDKAEQAARDAEDITKKMQGNEAAFAKLKKLMDERFKAVVNATLPKLQHIRTMANAQYADRIEPLEAVRHTDSDQLLRYIKNQGKELGHLLMDEKRLKDSIKKAKTYPQFEHDFVQLTNLYLHGLELVHHLIENDKVVIYRLKHFLGHLLHNAEKLEKSGKSPEEIEKVITGLTQSIYALKTEIYAVLGNIADQARLMRNEIGKELDAVV